MLLEQLSSPRQLLFLWYRLLAGPVQIYTLLPADVFVAWLCDGNDRDVNRQQDMAASIIRFIGIILFRCGVALLLYRFR